MSGRNFSLTDRLSGFVDTQVKSGRHQNASEVVREALRRYEDAVKQEEVQLEAIRDLIREGREAKASGDYEVVRGQDDEARIFEEMTGRAPRWRAAPRV